MKRYKVTYYHPLYGFNENLIADGEITFFGGDAYFMSGEDNWMIPGKLIRKIIDCETGNEIF